MVTKDLKIGELLMTYPNRDLAAGILMSMGMHCLGCPASQAETLEQACMVHGVDVDGIVNKLNAAYEEYEAAKKAQG